MKKSLYDSNLSFGEEQNKDTKKGPKRAKKGQLYYSQTMILGLSGIGIHHSKFFDHE